MSKSASFKAIVKSPLFRKTLETHLGNTNVVSVQRPHSYIIRARKEGHRVVRRLIVLPPKGCTADRSELLNPHPEARWVKVYVYGEIDPLKNGYRPLASALILRVSKKRDVPTEKRTPYAVYQRRYSEEKKKSWKNWFYVVKENGWGNFHNLINHSNKWLVLAIEKQLVDRRPMNIQKYLKKLPSRTAEIFRRDIDFVVAQGDAVFSHASIVQRILAVPPTVLTPVLIRLLNVPETGEHQNCTFFAFILKVAQRHKTLVQSFIREAMLKKVAPYYYLEDLGKKLL